MFTFYYGFFEFLSGNSNNSVIYVLAFIGCLSSFSLKSFWFLMCWIIFN